MVNVCVNCTSAFDDLTFVLLSSRWKDLLCSNILYGKLHVLLSIKLHCVCYSYAWDSSVRSWKFSSSLYWSGVRERQVGSMGLNMDVSPLVEESVLSRLSPIIFAIIPSANWYSRCRCACVEKSSCWRSSLWTRIVLVLVWLRLLCLTQSDQNDVFRIWPPNTWFENIW